MTRTVLIVSLFCASIVGALASDVDPLLKSTGAEFRKVLDALAGDPAIVTRLRESPITATGSIDLRRELLRRIVLARAEAPEAFAAFDDLISLVRPDSPMLPTADWWYSVKQYEPPDETLLRSAMEKWLIAPPANADEWIKVYRLTSPQVSEPSPKCLANRFWPPIAFGLSADQAHLRRSMTAPFIVLCNENGYGEVELEAWLWLCEMTSFDSEVTVRYRQLINRGFDEALGDNKARFIARRLSMLEAGENFIKANNGPGVINYLNSAEEFGASSHVPALRRLSEMPIWSVYRDRMLEIVDNLQMPVGPTGAP